MVPKFTIFTPLLWVLMWYGGLAGMAEVRLSAASASLFWTPAFLHILTTTFSLISGSQFLTVTTHLRTRIEIKWDEDWEWKSHLLVSKL
jgi:hypothetical protein